MPRLVMLKADYMRAFLAKIESTRSHAEFQDSGTFSSSFFRIAQKPIDELDAVIRHPRHNSEHDLFIREVV
jgi:hypothetical protein